MNSKTKSKPSWLAEITEISTPDKKTVQTEFIEPFEKNKQAVQQNLIEFNGFTACVSRPQTRKRFDYLLRIDDDLNDVLGNCQGSKNSVINALLRYAIEDLRAKNKTLLS